LLTKAILTLHLSNKLKPMTLELTLASPELTLKSKCLEATHTFELACFPTAHYKDGNPDFVRLYAQFSPVGETTYYCYGRVDGTIISRQDCASTDLQIAIDEYNNFFDRWRPTGR
jgi:hypothetical protein